METMTSADLSIDFDVASFREPTIAELLQDPLTRALMKADHVDADDLERRLRFKVARAAAKRLAVSYKMAVGAPSSPRVQIVPGILAKAPRTGCGSHCTW